MKVLLCGGGQWQKDIYNYLTKNNHDVYIVSPQTPDYILDKAKVILADLKNLWSILQYLNINKLQFDLITSDQSDLGIQLASKLTSILGLKTGIPDHVCRFYNDKYLSSLLIKKIADQHSKDFVIVNNHSELSTSRINNSSGIVIKPLDSQSSKGVCFYNSISEITKEEFERISEYSTSNQCIIENFIPGIEYTCEGIVQGGVFYPIIASKKSHSSFGIANSLDFHPNHLESLKKLQVTSILSKYVQSTGLLNGFIHAELIVNENNFTLVEIACRGGGTRIGSLVLSEFIGKESYNFIFEKTSDLKPILKSERMNWSGIILFFFQLKNSDRLREKELEIKKLPFVLDCKIETDNHLSVISDDRSRHGYFIGRYKAKTDKENHINQIEKLLT